MTRLVMLAVVLVGCTDDGKAGPAVIKWDRDQCAGCGMVISEPHFAAQIRGGPKGAVAKFDDVGCAVKWLDRQPWAGERTMALWVARHADGQWLDAKTAKYVTGKSSPMGFNLAALDPSSEGLTFEAVRKRVQVMDRKH